MELAFDDVFTGVFIGDDDADDEDDDESSPDAELSPRIILAFELLLIVMCAADAAESLSKSCVVSDILPYSTSTLNGSDKCSGIELFIKGIHNICLYIENRYTLLYRVDLVI
ncbi:hypothetical protein PPL_08462 [Heterostelium album PN500]|uniref:Uncharacterized protein n=1 Tax=Heterostelium pallidum (strain ATCC 26659 / Pp 5 / PN500) TaxID=670386 RepID=D3BI94_HETP5|nr:hypothetical protein PPL_08462 [Heterostelium album PN500]EFA78994.1 hypothetical protein PPL_08462 [Heterostelium album PN500]|eukprot:XP_020431118.1 hypothetical protein PPL_08462 [Heterostelium album PN500]